MVPGKYWAFSPPAHWGRDRGVKRGICYFLFHWGKGQNKTKCRKHMAVSLKFVFTDLLKAVLKSHFKSYIYCTNKWDFKKRYKLSHNLIILKQLYFFVFFFCPVWSVDIILIRRNHSTHLAFCFFIYSILCRQ